MKKLIEDANQIIKQAIQEVLPGKAVIKALEHKNFKGQVYVVAIGKAAWTMAHAAHEFLGSRIVKGIVITKYGHSQKDIPQFEIIEAGHPLLDENSIIGTKKVLSMVQGLDKKDTVLFLISGGGSALFEKPMDNLNLHDIIHISDQLLKCGADIIEINTIRKHLSQVKGGRFALACAPAKVYSIVLSDVLGDRLDSIASGPAYPDQSTSQDALEIIEKYQLSINEDMKNAIQKETPKHLDNCETVITGSVRELCRIAAKEAENLGYTPLILTTTLDCEAKEAGKFFSAIARSVREENFPIKAPCAIIAGGETVVKITGTGKGGRNQEMALAAASGISDLENVVFCSIGSDGTDGPTDAAGGLVCSDTKKILEQKNISIDAILSDNNSYEALQACNGLILTGPTGTNVNDLQLLLIQ